MTSYLEAYNPSENASTQTATNDTSTNENNSSSGSSSVTGSTSNSGTQSSVAEAPSGQVYTTPTGKKYHRTRYCGGPNSSLEDYSHAVSRDLEPCKKCY